ncbi:MAG: hypothetical protein ABI113_05330 [Mucilaginibacter sp.]
MLLKAKKTSKPMDLENLENTLKHSDSYVHDMLQFYGEGWDARGTDDKKNFEARLKANVITTITYISEVIDQFAKSKLKVEGAFIKLEKPNSLAVLFSVPIETFLDKALYSVYKYIHSIEQKSRSENYRIVFSVSYDDGSLDSECLLSEGFIKTHSIE